MPTKTINKHPITSQYGQVDFHVWEDDEGFHTCRTGEWRGIASESDDLGPFNTAEEALQAQEDDFDAYAEAWSENYRLQQKMDDIKAGRPEGFRN